MKNVNVSSRKIALKLSTVPHRTQRHETGNILGWWTMGVSTHPCCCFLTLFLTLITFLFNSIGFSSVELYFLVFANFSDRIWVTVLNWKLAILFHLRIEIHDAGWNAIRLSSGVGPWHLIRSQILEKLHPRNWKRNGNKAREWNFSVKVFSRL